MKLLNDLRVDYATLTFDALIAARAANMPDKVALRFEDETYSYRQLDEITRALANGLRAMGVRKGMHTAILAANSARYLLVYYALARMGAVSCPVNTAAKGALLTYFLTQSKCQLVVIDAEHRDRYAEVIEHTPQVLSAIHLDAPRVGDNMALPPRVRNAFYDELLSTVARPDVEAVSAQDVHGIFYTSGTTGPSKGIVASTAEILSFAGGRAEYLGIYADSVVYTCLPLFHGNALHTAAVAAHLAGATLTLGRRFSASGFWNEVRRFGATQFNLLSSMTDILWSRPPAPDDRNQPARQCTMVPVPEFARDFEQRFDIRIVSSYALSDFGQGTFLQPGFPAEKFRSAGLPRPGITLRIVDDNDAPQPPGTAGEIQLRSALPWIGHRSYYRMPEATAEANRGGWFRTGDRGYLDSDGYLYFVDRKKDAIRRRGENISSWEVEQAILRHPDVAEAAVIPIPSGMSEDEVLAFVVCLPGKTIAHVDLIRFCERNMAYFMVPRFVEFVPDLPRTITQKVQKTELRQQALERIDTIWDREKAGIVLTR